MEPHTKRNSFSVKPFLVVAAAHPQATCTGLLSLHKPCKAADVLTEQRKQYHSWQNEQHTIISKDKKKAEQNFQKNEQMKLIIRQFQRQTLGGLRGGVAEFRKGKPEAAKGSQLFRENPGSVMPRGIERQNLITAWSQAEVGKRAQRFCERCKLWKQTQHGSEWCTLGSTAAHHFCSPLWSLRGCPGLGQATAASVFRNNWDKPEISQPRCFQQHTHNAARQSKVYNVASEHGLQRKNQHQPRRPPAL